MSIFQKWYWRMAAAVVLGGMCGTILLVLVASTLTTLLPEWAEAAVTISIFILASGVGVGSYVYMDAVVRADTPRRRNPLPKMRQHPAGHHRAEVSRMWGEDMIRKAITASSLFFAVASLALWAASLWKPLRWSHTFNAGPAHLALNETYDGIQIWCFNGRIEISRSQLLYADNKFVAANWLKGVRPFFLVGKREGIRQTISSNPGFGVARRVRFVWVWLWFFPLVWAIYPAIAFIRGPLRRHRRRKKGLCVNCGYNLTGNVSGVCPECGERI